LNGNRTAGRPDNNILDGTRAAGRPDKKTKTIPCYLLKYRFTSKSISDILYVPN